MAVKEHRFVRIFTWTGIALCFIASFFCNVNFWWPVPFTHHVLGLDRETVGNLLVTAFILFIPLNLLRYFLKKKYPDH